MTYFANKHEYSAIILFVFPLIKIKIGYLFMLNYPIIFEFKNLLEYVMYIKFKSWKCYTHKNISIIQKYFSAKKMSRHFNNNVNGQEYVFWK